MKALERHRHFEKHFLNRITPNQKFVKEFEKRLALFLNGHRGYPLNDHALSGKLAGKRAFSVTNNIRVIYIETAETIILLDIGSHNQVYR